MRQPKYQRAVLSFTLVLSLILLLQTGSTAQGAAIKNAKVTQVLDSSQVFIQNKPAKVNDQANKGQRVRTGDARAELVFNTGAVGRLAHQSVLTIGQCARLRQGTILINGAVNGCTASIVAGVRGTTYLMEVNPAGEANIKVLEGEVSVAPVSPSDAIPTDEDASDEPESKTKQFSLPIPFVPVPAPSPSPEATPTPAPEASPVPTDDTQATPGDQQSVVVKAGEQVTVSPTGQPGLVIKLTQEEFTQLLKGNLFNGFALELPGLSKVRDSFQRLFPGVPFPIPVRVPLPIPTIPIRLPF